MSKNHKIKKQNQKKLIYGLIAILIVLIIVAILIICGSKNGDKGTTGISNEEISLGEGLKIVQMGEYNGPYLEDGSNEEVSGIQMIVLENTTKQDLQYAEINVEHKDKIAEYAVTNIPAGGKVLVLEKNRMESTKKTVKNTSLNNVVFLDEMPLYKNTVEIQGMDGIINVKNISANDIRNDFYIYYKNINEEMYLGGITYRVKIEGGLKTGEIRQLGANHFKAVGCEILMVSGLE